MSKKQPKPKKVNPYRQFLRQRYFKFMDSKGTEGSYLVEFKDHERHAIATDPEVREQYEAFTQFGRDFAWEQTWHAVDKLGNENVASETAEEIGEQLNFFSIGGYPVKIVLRYHDETVPGGYRSTLSPHATIMAQFGQAQVTQEQANYTAAAAERQLKQANLALQRAGGRAAELLFNVRDLGDGPGDADGTGPHTRT